MHKVDPSGSWSLVQLDEEKPHSLAQSDPICSSAGCDQYKHKTTPRGYPIDYKVPNFGMDKDIAGGLANIPVAEKIVGQQWNNFGTEESAKKWSNPAKKVLYDMSPALDGNIRDSLKNLSDTETNLNHKYQLLQMESSSDPICSSAGCGQYKHPKS